MAKTLVNTVIDQLQSERSRLENELRRVSAALSAFGKVYLQGSKARAAAATTAGRSRTISAAGRKRIAAAQRARWAKVRAAKKSKGAKA